MQHLLKVVEDKQKKARVADVKSGDTVRVHQRITEGSKTRTQVFEGLVIRLDRSNELTARIVVRRIASGVGVEKSFLLHSPLVERVEVIKRSRVRRNYLTYMRARSGKSAKLIGVDFDKEGVNISIEEQRAQALQETQPVAETTTPPAAAESKSADSAPPIDTKTEQPKAESESVPAAETAKVDKN